MIKCGSCGSGVTAQEKFKKIKRDGSIKRYVYYNCNRFRNYDCKEGYIREEALIEQLLKVIDRVKLDKFSTLKKMQCELERHQKFNNLISKVNNQEEIKMPEVDIKEYAKYLLLEGTKDEKREILACLKTQLYLKDQKIYLNKKKDWELDSNQSFS